MSAADATPRPGRRGWPEPTLVRRSVWSVLAAFFVVWGVLLGYLFATNKQAIANNPALPKFGDALLAALAPIDNDAEARATLKATEHWTNIRRHQNGLFPGDTLYELLNAKGERVYASAALAQVAWASPLRTMDEITLHGAVHRVYEGRDARWTLRIADPKRTDSAFLSYNGRVLLPYLLLALPIVLLPVWLSVRNGLRPLQLLAAHIARRPAGDLAPVGFEARHRELKPLVHALDALLERLRHKIAHERAFVHDAAHEVRTPLAVINAQAHVLAHASEAATRQQALAHLEQAIARTSHLSQQLLALAALDHLPPAERAPLDVAQWLRQSLALAVPAAMARDIELSLEAPDNLWRTLERPTLESILNNLVDNAVRYGRPGGSVVVTLHDEEGRLALTVQDDGPGIAPAEQARVFERFHRGAGHDATGSGLGLSIVRAAATRLGGTVHLIDGLAGRGVGFLVNLPDPHHFVR